MGEFFGDDGGLFFGSTPRYLDPAPEFDRLAQASAPGEVSLGESAGDTLTNSVNTGGNVINTETETMLGVPTTEDAPEAN